MKRVSRAGKTVAHPAGRAPGPQNPPALPDPGRLCEPGPGSRVAQPLRSNAVGALDAGPGERHDPAEVGRAIIPAYHVVNLREYLARADALLAAGDHSRHHAVLCELSGYLGRLLNPSE